MARWQWCPPQRSPTKQESWWLLIHNSHYYYYFFCSTLLSTLFILQNYSMSPLFTKCKDIEKPVSPSETATTQSHLCGLQEEKRKCYQFLSSRCSIKRNLAKCQDPITLCYTGFYFQTHQTKCYDGINLLAEGHQWQLLHTSFSGVRHDLFISGFFSPSLEILFYWMLYGPARVSCHHKADAPIGVGFHIITRWCNLGWDAAIYTVAKGIFLFLLLLSSLLLTLLFLLPPSGSSDSFQTLEKGHFCQMG